MWEIEIFPPMPVKRAYNGSIVACADGKNRTIVSNRMTFTALPVSARKKTLKGT